MMCACDEAFGNRFLSHQLNEGTELRTRQRIPVTHGFQPSICRECRGLPADPAPAGEIHGRISKIKRFYWRELFFEETLRKADWDEAHPKATENARKTAHIEIKKQALEDIKKLHSTQPKYVTSEPSQAEVIKRYAVEVLPIVTEYVEVPQKGAVIRDGEEAISPESFAIRRFENERWTVTQLESAPFHALFGVMMWLLIQDPVDPRVQTVGFGDRAIYETGSKPAMIWTLLPEDFGCPGYSERRQKAIERHFQTIPADRTELLWLFDYWRDYSAELRQYLWAHREFDVDRARRLIEILPPISILAVLRYLVEDYWGRYLGWPDLLLSREEEILLVEVKSSGDRLSQAQKAWIAGNHSQLHLPFKLVKLHRAQKKRASSSLYN